MDRSYTYQKGWTEDFAHKADVLFIVEKEVLPVHSVMFYESSILQECLADTAAKSKPRMESCFLNYNVEEVVAFLCQVYPLPDSERVTLKKNFCAIVDIGHMLECRGTLNSVGRFLEDNSGVVLERLKVFEKVPYVNIFTMVRKIESTKLDATVMAYVAQNFQSIKTKFSDSDLSSTFSTLPGECVLKLALNIFIPSSKLNVRNRGG